MSYTNSTFYLCEEVNRVFWFSSQECFFSLHCLCFLHVWLFSACVLVSQSGVEAGEGGRLPVPHTVPLRALFSPQGHPIFSLPAPLVVESATFHVCRVVLTSPFREGLDPGGSFSGSLVIACRPPRTSQGTALLLGSVGHLHSFGLHFQDLCGYPSSAVVPPPVSVILQVSPLFENVLPSQSGLWVEQREAHVFTSLSSLGMRWPA